MKTKRKYVYLDDFEHRLLVGCLMTARNEYIHEDNENCNALIVYNYFSKINIKKSLFYL